MSEKDIEELKTDKPSGLWSRVKRWANTQNIHPIIFTSHCCNSMWELVEDEEYVLMNGTRTADELNGPDLMIIHGPVNNKKMALILDTYENMSGEKFVIGIGSCLMPEGEYLPNQVKNIDKILPFDVIIPGCNLDAKVIIEVIRNIGDRR